MALLVLWERCWWDNSGVKIVGIVLGGWKAAFICPKMSVHGPALALYHTIAACTNHTQMVKWLNGFHTWFGGTGEVK